MPTNNYHIPLSNNKIILYAQIEKDELTGNNRSISTNQNKFDMFINGLVPGQFLKYEVTKLKRRPSDRQRGFLHGGIIEMIAKTLGLTDTDYVKRMIKKQFLKIEFKTDLDGKVIIDPETNLPRVRENQYFDLTELELKQYYTMYLLDPTETLMYPTEALSKDKYAKFMTNLITWAYDHLGIVIEAKYV